MSRPSTGRSLAAEELSSTDYSDSSSDGEDRVISETSSSSREVPSAHAPPPSSYNPASVPPKLSIPPLKFGAAQVSQPTKPSRPSAPVPRLQLLQTQENANNTPRSARGPKRSGLKINLGINLSTASKDAAPEKEAPIPSTSCCEVSLISSAFSVRPTETRNERLGDVVAKKTVGALGIATHDLKYYELRELCLEQVTSSGITHVGVAVNKSGFSLSAMEELIADNKRLAATAEKTASALESSQNLVKDYTQTLVKSQLKASEHEAEARRMQERCRILERELNNLRQRLQRSDNLNSSLSKEKDQFKQQLQQLRQQTAAGFQGSQTRRLASPQRRAGDAAPTTSMDARTAKILERLCDDKFVGQLERLMDRLET